MARRKAVKHADTEPVERAAEAGDASPPKRKKAVAKTTAKSEEDKPARPARAAKSVRTEQPDSEAGSAPATTNAKAKGKASAAKNATAPAKPSAKAKTSPKKAKEALEKSNNGPIETETTKNGGEIQPKKARAKAATKKAGTADGDEPKAKPKGRGKKAIPVEEAEDSEVSPSKKKKIMNAPKVVTKEAKPKGRATKKKIDESTETTKKVATTKGQAKGSVQKRGKVIEDKATKPAARGTRARKNKAVIETMSEEGDEAKTEGETASESSQSTENEVEDGQSQESDPTVPVQPLKRGRNMAKKDESVAPKKTAKTRGKVAEPATEEDGVDTAKSTKETQKKSGKENATSAVASKRGARKKGVTVNATANEESSDKKTDTEDTSMEEKEVLNTTQTLHVNNNIEKSEEEPENEEHEGTLRKEYTVAETIETIRVEEAEN